MPAPIMNDSQDFRILLPRSVRATPMSHPLHKEEHGTGTSTTGGAATRYSTCTPHIASSIVPIATDSSPSQHEHQHTHPSYTNCHHVSFPCWPPSCCIKSFLQILRTEYLHFSASPPCRTAMKRPTPTPFPVIHLPALESIRESKAKPFSKMVELRRVAVETEEVEELMQSEGSMLDYAQAKPSLPIQQDRCL